jgi:predicted amidophosphoribosyltransferase
VESEKLNFKVVSLWSWKRDDNRHLSVFLSALKYHPIEQDWETLAMEFSRVLIQQNLAPQEAFVFVPCPSSTRNECDHARMLAKALGQYWQAPVFDALIKETTGHQKSKEFWERDNLRVQRVEKNSKDIPAGRLVILIDDVLTTGSTAKASIKALGTDRPYEVWCLAHRRLAGKTTV